MDAGAAREDSRALYERSVSEKTRSAIISADPRLGEGQLAFAGLDDAIDG